MSISKICLGITVFLLLACTGEIDQQYKKISYEAEIPVSWNFSSYNPDSFGLEFSVSQNEIKRQGWNSQQIDVFVVSAVDIDQGIADLKKENDHIIWSEEFVDGRRAVVATRPYVSGVQSYYLAGGKNYFIYLTDSALKHPIGVIINKGGKQNSRFELDFQYFLTTLDLDKFIEK